MATVAPQKLGPGHLRFGAVGSAQEFGSLTTKTELDPEVKEEEPVGLLGGQYYVDPGEILGTLKGVFYQEYSMEGLVAWTWKNAGKVMEFEFRPRSDSALTVKGKCKIKPVKIGGDALKDNTAEFEFKLTETPIITSATSSVSPTPGG